MKTKEEKWFKYILSKPSADAKEEIYIEGLINSEDSEAACDSLEQVYSDEITSGAILTVAQRPAP